MMVYFFLFVRLQGVFKSVLPTVLEATKEGSSVKGTVTGVLKEDESGVFGGGCVETP